MLAAAGLEPWIFTRATKEKSSRRSTRILADKAGNLIFVCGEAR
jgi:hypothetical protein